MRWSPWLAAGVVGVVAALPAQAQTSPTFTGTVDRTQIQNVPVNTSQAVAPAAQGFGLAPGFSLGGFFHKLTNPGFPTLLGTNGTAPAGTAPQGLAPPGARQDQRPYSTLREMLRQQRRRKRRLLWGETGRLDRPGAAVCRAVGVPIQGGGDGCA